MRVRIARGTTPNAMTIVRAIVCDESGAVQFAQRARDDEPARSICEALERLVGGDHPTGAIVLLRR